MAAEHEKYDEVLMTVAGQCGGIQPLFDVFFSFLFRKTDFFHVMKEGDKMGFPPGVAEKILLSGFKRYEQAAADMLARRDGDRPNEATAPAPSSAPKPSSKAAPAAAKPAPKAPTAAAAPPAAPGGAPASVAGAAKSHLRDFAGVPYNGARTDKYTWEQTLNDVTITVPVPAGTKARDVVCVISKGHLRVGLKGGDPVIDADFPLDDRNGQQVWEKVRADESYWNLGKASGEGEVVTVYLEKEREAWWKSAVAGGAEIDTQQVDSTRSMYDYDDETQGAIRKIMFDEVARQSLPPYPPYPPLPSPALPCPPLPSLPPSLPVLTPSSHAHAGPEAQGPSNERRAQE